MCQLGVPALYFVVLQTLTNRLATQDILQFLVWTEDAEEQEQDDVVETLFTAVDNDGSSDRGRSPKKDKKKKRKGSEKKKKNSKKKRKQSSSPSSSSSSSKSESSSSSHEAHSHLSYFLVHMT